MKEKMQGEAGPPVRCSLAVECPGVAAGLVFLAKLLTDGRFHYDLSIFLDDKIPFVPFFMLIYWGRISPGE